MAIASKLGGVTRDRGGVTLDEGGVGLDRGGVGSDIPEGTTIYDPRKSYSAGQIIWHAGWEAEGTVVDFAPPRSTMNPFPQTINFRDFRDKVGSEAKPVFMDVNFKSSVGADKRPGIKTLICNIPVEKNHVPPQSQTKPKGGVAPDAQIGVDTLDAPRGGVAPA